MGALGCLAISVRLQRLDDVSLKRSRLIAERQRINQRRRHGGVLVAALDIAVPDSPVRKLDRTAGDGNFTQIERGAHGTGATAHHHGADLRCPHQRVVGQAMGLRPALPQGFQLIGGSGCEDGKACLPCPLIVCQVGLVCRHLANMSR